MSEPWTSPHCRLAAQMTQYTDEHERCPAVEDVHTPDGTLISHRRCACACHQDS